MPIPNKNVSLLSASVCHGTECAGRCSPYTDAVIVAGSTLENSGNPVLYVNMHGGDPDEWEANTITEWTVGDINDVLCLGSFVVMVSTEEKEVLRSDDLGTTRVVVADATTHPDFNNNPPTCVGGVDRTMILIGGKNGYIYGSYDGLVTLETLDAGNATTEDITQMAIAPDNNLVAYAIGANNAMIKTENGGLTWFAINGPSVGDNLTAICVVSQNRLLVGNDDGELWQSVDGGDTWELQLALPGQPATSEITAISTYRNSDVFYLAVKDRVGTDHVLYRNVNGGASGLWEVLHESTLPILDIAVVNQNHVVGVGGNGVSQGLIVQYK